MGKLRNCLRVLGSPIINVDDTTRTLVKSQHTISLNVMDLYGKIEDLSKRVEELEGERDENAMSNSTVILPHITTCPKCNGTGIIEVEPGAYTDCGYCDGSGILDLLKGETN